MSMDKKYKLDVVCTCCKQMFNVSKYDVADAERWTCKPCVMTKRNKAAAKPNGSVRLHAQSGYLEEKSNNKWRRQHILIMERSIGRRITSSEDVHHKNEIKTDNRLDNLELMTHGEHTTLHNLGKEFSPERRHNIALAKRSGVSAKLTPESV